MNIPLAIKPRVLWPLLWLCSLCLTLSANAAGKADNLTQLAQQMAAQATAPLIEIEQFIQSVGILSVSLSPDGDRLAYIAREKHGQALYLMNTTNQTSERLFLARNLTSVVFANDGKQLLLHTTNGGAYLNIGEKHATTLFRLNRKSDERILGIETIGSAGFYLTEQVGNAYRLSLLDTQGKRQLLLNSKWQIMAQLSDNQGQLKVVKLATKDSYSIEQVIGDKTKPVLKCLVTDICHLKGYDDKANRILLQTNLTQDRSMLASVDLATAKISEIHSDPKQASDVYGTWIERKSAKARLISYYYHQKYNYALDNTLEKPLRALESQLGSTAFSVSLSPKLWLIRHNPTTLQHPEYYLFNLKDKQLTAILQAHRNSAKLVAPKSLAQLHGFNYIASDGMKLQGYLAMPKGKDLSKTPLVTFVHGGPWSRVYDDYSSTVQLMVNRGYSVFIPNFRASTGFGKSYVDAAAKNYGNGPIQQDILDGIDYLLSQGIGHQDKLGIMGESYGGFATLGSLSYTADKFAGGIAIAPPTNQYEAFRWMQDKGMKRQGLPIQLTYDAYIGNLDSKQDAQRVTNHSPTHHYNKLKKPLLIIAGGRDQKVNINTVRDYVADLLGHHQDVSLLVDKNADHSLANRQLRKARLVLIEQFWHRTLGGASKTVKDQALRRYIKRNLVHAGKSVEGF